MKKIIVLLISALFAVNLFATTIVPVRIGNSTSIMVINNHVHSGSVVKTGEIKITETFKRGKRIGELYEPETIYKITKKEYETIYSECECSAEPIFIEETIAKANSHDMEEYNRRKRNTIIAVTIALSIVIVLLILFIRSFHY